MICKKIKLIYTKNLLRFRALKSPFQVMSVLYYAAKLYKKRVENQILN